MRFRTIALGGATTMPVLPNARHERFAQALAKGKTADEAYQEAGFVANRGNATRLKANESVAARVAELQSKAAERAVFTAADMARQLDEDREFARSVKQAGAVVSASMGKAKVLGLITDKMEHTGADGGPIETAEVSGRDLIERRIAGLAARGATEGNSGKPH